MRGVSGAGRRASARGGRASMANASIIGGIIGDAPGVLQKNGFPQIPRRQGAQATARRGWGRAGCIDVRAGGVSMQVISERTEAGRDGQQLRGTDTPHRDAHPPSMAYNAPPSLNVLWSVRRFMRMSASHPLSRTDTRRLPVSATFSAQPRHMTRTANGYTRVS